MYNMRELMEQLVASTLLRTWVYNTKMKETEEGQLILDLLSEHQQKSLADATTSLEEAKTIADRAAKVVLSCMDVIDISDRVCFIYATLIVLFAAENQGVLKFERADDELALTMFTLQQTMDRVTQRNDQLGFSKQIMSAAERLSARLVSHDLFYVGN